MHPAHWCGRPQFFDPLTGPTGDRCHGIFVQFRIQQDRCVFIEQRGHQTGKPCFRLTAKSQQIDVVAVESGQLRGFSVLPGGGERVTHALRQSHLLDGAEAEHAKRSEGDTEEGRAALEPVVGEFAVHVQRAIRGGLRSQDWRQATIHLAGGGAQLTGLIQHLEQTTGLEVRTAGVVDSLTPDPDQACALASEVGCDRRGSGGRGHSQL